ncbi:CGNR zinc finger domain-containing protein [Rhodococcus sp. NPDC059968]|uniref:CGNR zinc finger domain-containing protein n=1 Tax=Rhodococcus sp. NPDC059968 TaxID=3347017 RepID=UPI00367088CC
MAQVPAVRLGRVAVAVVMRLLEERVEHRVLSKIIERSTTTIVEHEDSVNEYLRCCTATLTPSHASVSTPCCGCCNERHYPRVGRATPSPACSNTEKCESVYADISRHGCQRYCSPICSNRDAVRLHRRRGSAQPTISPARRLRNLTFDTVTIHLHSKSARSEPDVPARRSEIA